MSKGTFVSKPIEKYVRDRLPVFDTMLSNLCKNFNNSTDFIVQCIQKAYFSCSLSHLSVKNIEDYIRRNLNKFIRKYNQGFQIVDESIDVLLNYDSSQSRVIESYPFNRAYVLCCNALVRLFWLTDFISDKKNEHCISTITWTVLSEGAVSIIDNDARFNRLYDAFLSDLRVKNANLFPRRMFVLMLKLLDNKISNQFEVTEKDVVLSADLRGNLRNYLTTHGNKAIQTADVIKVGKAILFARARNLTLQQTLAEMGRFDTLIDSYVQEYVKSQKTDGAPVNIAKTQVATEAKKNNEGNSNEEKPLSHEETIIKQAREGINNKSELFYLLAEKLYVPTWNLLNEMAYFIVGEKWVSAAIRWIFAAYNIKHKVKNKVNNDDKNEYLFACIQYDLGTLPTGYSWLFSDGSGHVSQKQADIRRCIKAYIELLYEAAKTSFGKNEIRAAMYLIFRENYIRYFYEKYVSKINVTSFDEYVSVLKDAALRDDNLTMWRCYYLYTTKASEGLFKGVSDLEKEAAAKLEEYKIKMARARLLEGAQTIEVRDAVVTNSSKSAYGIKFEKLIAALFEKMEYKVSFTKTTGDYGIDIIADDDIVRIAIQCKCYHGHSVGNDAVQQAVSGKEFYGCDKAMVVTNSTFTPAAIEQAKKSNVILWNRHVLQKMLDAYMPGVRLD